MATYEENYGSTPGVDGTPAKQQQQQPGKQEGTGEKDNCCVSMAKCWITLIGLIAMLFAAFLIFVAIYTKYFYGNYQTLNNVLKGMGVSAAVWIILGFGVVLVVCSLLLILAGCCHDKAACTICSKLLLGVFATILIILLLAEIASSAAVFFYMGWLKLPAGNGTALGTFEQQAVDARTAAVESTFNLCCVNSRPPYDSTNQSVVDDACLWPAAADTSPGAFSEVYNTCNGLMAGYTNDAAGVEACLCNSDAAWYGQVAGVFLSQNIMWVGIVGLVFALLLLFGVIASCSLVCHHHHTTKTKGEMYTDARTN